MDELFQFRLPEIDIDINIDGNFTTRYIQPKQCFEIPERFLKYRLAKDLAESIEIKKNSRAFVFVDGKFQFGDFIEALIVAKNYKVYELVVSTLSMSQNNVDSLQNLITGNYVDSLSLIVSDYFYTHEKYGLVPYIYQELDIKNNFQMAVCSSHCKIATIKTENGGFIVIHGSANLRSSSNIEQVVIEENEELFNFVNEVNQNIILEYATINKSIRNSKLWHQVVKKDSEQ